MHPPELNAHVRQTRPELQLPAIFYSPPRPESDDNGRLWGEQSGVVQCIAKGSRPK
jgi:hypothetical protein